MEHWVLIQNKIDFLSKKNSLRILVFYFYLFTFQVGYSNTFWMSKGFYAQITKHFRSFVKWILSMLCISSFWNLMYLSHRQPLRISINRLRSALWVKFVIRIAENFVFLIGINRKSFGKQMKWKLILILTIIIYETN